MGVGRAPAGQAVRSNLFKFLRFTSGIQKGFPLPSFTQTQ